MSRLSRRQRRKVQKRWVASNENRTKQLKEKIRSEEYGIVGTSCFAYLRKTGHGMTPNNRKVSKTSRMKGLHSTKLRYRIQGEFTKLFGFTDSEMADCFGKSYFRLNPSICVIWTADFEVFKLNFLGE